MLPVRRIFIGAFIAALVLIFPLRVALGMAGAPIQASFVGGFVWGGRLVDARLGGLSLGNLQAGLSPLDLLLGRMRFWVNGRFDGALVSGLGGTGADVKALSLSLTRPIGGVMLTQVELSNARIRFSGKDCREASGRIQLVFAPSPLSAGQTPRYSGDLRCEGGAVAATLSSQSAMERLTVRIDRAGAYAATLTVRAQDQTMADLLRATGFREAANGFSMTARGKI